MNKGSRKGDLNDSYRNSSQTNQKGESPHSSKDNHKHKKGHKNDHSSQQ